MSEIFKKEMGQIRRIIANIEKDICEKPGAGINEKDEKFIKELKKADIKFQKAYLEYNGQEP